MRKNVAVIGAGIAGLSAGCYLQKNGYNTEIFELHTVPGGLCTAWKRKDFMIEGCIHWLVGSNPASNFYQLWNELVNMRQIDFIEPEEFMRVEDQSGHFIRVFSDIDKLEREFMEKAPEDRECILEFTQIVRKFLHFNLPLDKAPEVSTIFDGIKLMARIFPYMGAARKWMKISVREYAERYKNPLLKRTFTCLFWPEMSMFFVVMMMVYMHRKDAGYPIGGSLKFARLIEESYKRSGGTIHYGSRVQKILTEENRVVGLVLENGETHAADIVISAADGHATLFEMLDGKYLDAQQREYYEYYDIFPSYLQISLGVSRTFDPEPHALFFQPEQPIMVDSEARWDTIGVRIFTFDSTVAPSGNTLLTVMLPTANYTYWEQLRQDDREKYRAEKERVADQLIEALDRRFGRIREHLVMVDVSTPATVIRYTNNWKGTFEGWVLNPKMGLRRMKKTLPGLKNFYMTGQWVEPGGGVPTALLSGRNVAQLICKDDKISFTATP